MRVTVLLAFIFLVTICFYGASVWAESQPASEGQGVETISDEGEPLEDSIIEDEEWEDDDEEIETALIKDPIQPYNRAVFYFNDKAYYYVIKPVYKGYSAVLPEQVRLSVRKFFLNIKTPIRLFNCLFQGKLNGAGVETLRLIINSTVGVGGLFDPAKSQFNLEIQDEDFGQSLAQYGMGTGIFIEWPLIGPSSVRGTLGFVGDMALNPLTFISYVFDDLTSFGVNTGDQVNEFSLDRGDAYENITIPAIDPYIALQDAYIQNRIKKIKE